jgi:hypothetical protein
MVKENRSGYKIFVIGDKGSIALARPLPDLMENAATNITNPMNFPTGKPHKYLSCRSWIPNPAKRQRM